MLTRSRDIELTSLESPISVSRPKPILEWIKNSSRTGGPKQPSRPNSCLLLARPTQITSTDT